MDIDFLRSTTTTTIDREADGDTKIRLEHIARFGIEPGTVADQNRRYGTWKFRPSWLEVTWRDGLLVEVRTSGPRVLKDRLSDKETAHTTWELRYGRDPETGKPYPFDRSRLPQPIADRIATYEQNVAVVSGKAR